MPSPVTVTKEGETRAMFKVHIKGAIDAVWHEITRTDAPIPAFFNTQMHIRSLEPGLKMAMRTCNGKYTGVVGTILDVDPPRLMKTTFKFTNYDDPECIVTHELAEVEGGVEYTMTISELPVGTKTAKQMMQGGVMIASTFKSVIETGRPSFGTRMLFILFKLMEPMSPKRSRSEHWPID